MKMIRTHEEFRNIVCKLYGPDCLEIGIKPDSPAGFFEAYSIDRLLAFCKENPSYHIVSLFGSITFNAVIPGAKLFMLAEGDPDPEIVLALRRSFEDYQRIRAGLLWQRTFGSEPNDVEYSG